MKISIEHVHFRKFEGSQEKNLPHSLFVGFLNSATIVTEITDESGVNHAFETQIKGAKVTYFFKTEERAAGFTVSMPGEAWTDGRDVKRYKAYVRVDPTAYKALLAYVSDHRDVQSAVREIWNANCAPKNES